MAQKVMLCGIDTSALPLVSGEHAEELIKRIKQGDERAREEFVLGNMRLVLSVVRRFGSKNACADDLFQAGCIGLIKSIDNFDTSFGVKFSTYAVPMIIGEIKRFLRGRNSMRVSRSIRDTAYQVLQARERLQKTMDEVTATDIAGELHIGERDVVYALDAISDPVSLFDPVYNKSGDELLLMDQISDDVNTDEIWTEKVALTSAIGSLDERERNILFLRYYEGKTQTEISSEIGLSQAQISRIEKTALSAVRLGLS